MSSQPRLAVHLLPMPIRLPHALLVSGILILSVSSASPQQATEAKAESSVRNAEFDVAAIKPSDPSVSSSLFRRNTHGVFEASGVTVKSLIEYAYNLHDIQILGGPQWIDRDRYDISAKSVAASEIDWSKLAPAQSRAMFEADVNRLRNLLADRFQLKCHSTTKDTPVFALTVAKNGPKFQPTPSSHSNTGYRIAPGMIKGHNITMSVLKDNLTSDLDRILIDQTGLQGQYDIDLEWTPGSPQHEDDAAAPSLRTALQEQLGLKIVSQRAPIPVLVLDQVEKPSAN